MLKQLCRYVCTHAYTHTHSLQPSAAPRVTVPSSQATTPCYENTVLVSSCKHALKQKCQSRCISGWLSIDLGVTDPYRTALTARSCLHLPWTRCQAQPTRGSPPLQPATLTTPKFATSEVSPVHREKLEGSPWTGNSCLQEERHLMALVPRMTLHTHTHTHTH